MQRLWSADDSSAFRPLFLVLLIMINTSGCVTSAISPKWPDKQFDRVVGYQFVNPPGIGSPFLDGKDAPSFKQLSQLKRKEAELSAADTEQLFKAMFSDEPPPKIFFACYEPHHIFVFYSGEKAVAAFEVCFLCSSSGAWPGQPAASNPSFKKLAGLCLSLGLGTDVPDDQEEVTKRYDRDHPVEDE
jgi:hypothetical protein